MSTGEPVQPQPTPPAPPVPLSRAEWSKWAFEKFGPLGVVLSLAAPWVYTQGEKISTAHVGLVDTLKDATEEGARNDTEKTEILGKLSDTMARTTVAVEKQTDLIREIKEDHKELRTDVRDIQRVLGNKRPVEPDGGSE